MTLFISVIRTKIWYYLQVSVMVFKEFIHVVKIVPLWSYMKKCQHSHSCCGYL